MTAPPGHEPSAEPPLLPWLLQGAARPRCPRCGMGQLFSGWLKVVDRCRVCGLDLSDHDSADGPAFFVSFVGSIALVVGALVVEVLWSPPFWVHAIIWPLAMGSLAAATLRPVKAMFVMLNWKHRRDAPSGQ